MIDEANELYQKEQEKKSQIAEQIKEKKVAKLKQLKSDCLWIPTASINNHQKQYHQ